MSFEDLNSSGDLGLDTSKLIELVKLSYPQMVRKDLFKEKPLKSNLVFEDHIEVPERDRYLLPERKFDDLFGYKEGKETNVHTEMKSDDDKIYYVKPVYNNGNIS